MFGEIAINGSGFSKLRPPLAGVPISGEPQLRAVPFQVISHYVSVCVQCVCNCACDNVSCGIISDRDVVSECD